MASILNRAVSDAIRSLQVVAVRDASPRLEPMLRVVEVCSAAGVSIPPEAVEFFGTAWRTHGPRVDPLREAMLYLRLPLDGDALQSQGVMIWRDALPPGTIELRVVASDSPSVSTMKSRERLSTVGLLDTPWPTTEPQRVDDANTADTVEYVEGDLELETYFNTHGNPYTAAEHLYNSIANHSNQNQHDQLRRMFAAHPQFVIDLVPLCALENNDLPALETLHKIGVPLDVRSEDGEPLIEAAARRGAREIVRFLLRANCHPER